MDDSDQMLLASMVTFVVGCASFFLPYIGEIAWWLWVGLLVVVWVIAHEVAKWLPSKP